ncbi:MAG: polyprenyl synthetase family protein [Clostridia bacterium]
MMIKEILEDKRIEIEDYLNTLLDEKGDLLRESMAYSLRAGGKRLRPSLFLIAAELYGLESAKVMPFAAGIEMIHTYSLIHDDLPAMDNDDYRRGRLTNHKVFGEAQAILAGDGLLTEAFAMMCRVDTSIPASRVIAAIALTAENAGINGMVRGQTKDIQAEGKSLTLDELRSVHYDKTGALIRLSVMAAGILAGVGEDDLKALMNYGDRLGLAFQIIDDILDHESTFEELGKPIGSDEENNKTTYITLLGVEGAKKAAEDAAKEADRWAEKLSVDGTVLKELCDELLNRRK